MTIRTIVKYYLLWQLALLIIGSQAGRWIPLRLGFLGPNYRANFDGIRYLSISEKGYLDYGQRAYFPMYPQAINWLGSLIQDNLIAALVISNSTFLIALVLLVKLVELDYPPRVAKYVVISLLVFPTSFYFGAAYTESLFLVFLLGCFYAVRRGKWWLAGILGAFASYTRFVGAMLLPAFFIELWQQHRGAWSRLSRLLPVLSILAGLGWYMWYLYVSVGDPLAFVRAQELFGQGRSNTIVLLHQIFYRYGKMIFTVNRSDPLYFTILLEAGVGILFLVLAVVAFRRLRLSYAIFNALAFIVPTFTGNLVSMPRYVLVCFPAFILIGTMLVNHPKLRPLIIGISLTLFIATWSMFSRGYWVG